MILLKKSIISKILRKYTALAQGLGSLGPVTVATEALNKYVTEFLVVLQVLKDINHYMVILIKYINMLIKDLRLL